MATAEAREFIQCSAAEAFAMLSHPDKHPLWQADLESDSIISGDGGIGSRGREMRRVMGRLVTMEYEVTQYHEPERWAMRSLSGPITMTGIMCCVSDSGGTQVRIEISFSGWYGEAMARFAKRQFRDYLRALKTLLEDGTVPAGYEVRA